MSSTPVIRTFASHEWNIYKVLRLGALADSPDAFGATFEQENDRPDTEWFNRLASGVASPFDLPLIAEVGKKPIGLAWGRIENSNWMSLTFIKCGSHQIGDDMAPGKCCLKR